MASTLFYLLLLAFTGESGCTILHFTTDWCQPCKQMRPAIEQLRQRGWDIRPVDTDRQRPIAEQFNVRNLPTLVIVSGGREVDRIVGMASYAEIEKRLVRAAARSGSGQRTASGASQPAQQASNSGPIVRGQSPGWSAVPRAVAGSLASAATVGGFANGVRGNEQPLQLTLDEAMHRAARATVRIRVDEGNTMAFGTGTIVHVRGDEALVLTCGHLFREMQPGAELTVDLFAGTPQEINVPSELIDFTANNNVDIGLISMSIPVMIEPVEILPRGMQVRPDQIVFSYGCDHGANPTRRETRVSKVNRYVGAANVEIVGAPAVGRSGGGLFDEQGRLIGVCNAANANENEGIYAAAEVVYTQLDRLNLSELYEHQGSTIAENSLATASSTRPYGQPQNISTAGNQRLAPPTRGRAQSTAQAEWPDEVADLTRAGAAGASANGALAGQAQSLAGPPAQVLCIVRDAQGNDQLITINAPTAELLERIRAHAGR